MTWDFMRIMACVLDTVEHLHIVILLCLNFGNIAFISGKTNGNALHHFVVLDRKGLKQQNSNIYKLCN